MRITWNADANAPGCPGEIVADDGRTVLVQTDWDCPSIARDFGWDMTRVQKCQECGEVDEDYLPTGCRECSGDMTHCPHDGTDGTIDCPCGVKASDFIAAAWQYLDDHDGVTAEDPGYFNEE